MRTAELVGEGSQHAGEHRRRADHHVVPGVELDDPDVAARRRTEVLDRGGLVVGREGLVTREPYQTNPPRFHYRLTKKGAELLPVIQALATWGAAHIGHTYDPPDILLQWQPEDHFRETSDDA